MWKNIVEPGRRQMIIWRMLIACCLPKATDTTLEYVTLIYFPTAAMVARKLLGVAIYVYCLPY